MVDVELQKRWIDALLFGKYDQGRNWLRSTSLPEEEETFDKFCCLGVACDIIDPTKWGNLDNIGVFCWNSNNVSLPKECRSKLGLSIEEEGTLIDMNDYGKSFAEIAEHLKKLFNLTDEINEPI